MRFLILSALVSASLCWSSSSFESPHASSETRYEEKKEYIYSYESQVLTGLPTFSKQYSGIKITCEAKLSMSSSDHSTLQLGPVSIYTMNQELQDQHLLPPLKQIPLSLWTPLPREETIMVTEKLSLPISFVYKNYKIVELHPCTDETNWSIDMKRAILGMLQVKLQADETDYKVTEKLTYNDLEKENVTTFDTLESALEGTCYTSLHVEATNRPKVFRVIKARDHSRCIKMNVVDKDVYPQRQINCNCKNNMNGETCQCLPVSNIWNIRKNSYDVARTEYDLLSEDKRHFVIKKAVQSVQFRMETPHASHQAIITYSNQSLTLKEIKNQVSFHKCRESIRSDPWTIHVLSKSQEQPIMSSQQIMNKAQNLLNELITISSQPQRTDDYFIVFKQLVEHLRLCNPQQLNHIFSETKHVGSQHLTKKWKVYVDALRLVNTTVADTLLINKIISGEIPNQKAASTLMTWTAEKVPTIPVLDLMHQSLLPAFEKNPSKKMVYNQAMLCFGSMIRRYIHSEEIKIGQCVSPVDKEVHQKNINRCRKYEKYVEGRLSSAQTDEDKILCLKTIANLGSMKSLPMLQSLLDPKETNTVRVHAIWAFKNLGFQNKFRVLQTLLPIMSDKQVDTELRIAAFVMVMRCNPTTSLLEVQKYLNDDLNLEFKTFVVQYLQNMLEVDQEPQCEDCEMRIRVVLKNIRGFRMSQKSTDFQMVYGVKSNDGNGDMVRISTIGHDILSIPKSSAIQHFTSRNKQYNHFYEIGYRAEGLEHLLSKASLESKSTSFFEETASELKRLLNPKHKCSGKDCGQAPSVTFYIRVLGQQVSFVHLDQQALASLFLSGSDKSFEIPMTLFETIVLTPRQVQILQPSGSWLNSKLHHFAIIDIDGKVKVELPSGKLPIITFVTNKPIRYNIQTLWSTCTVMGFASAGIASSTENKAFVKTGEKDTIRYNMNNNSFYLESTDPVPSQNKLIQADFKAVTETAVFPGSVPRFVATRKEACKELAVDESDKKTFDIKLPSLESIELDAKIKGEVNAPELYSFVRDRMMLLPTWLSIYKQSLSLDIHPVPSNRRTYVITANSRYFFPTESNSLEVRVLKGGKHKDQESEGLVESIFGSVFDMNDEESNEENVGNYSRNSFFQPRTLGSLCHFMGMSVASVNGNKILNMTANITTYYEHDYPTIRSLWKMVRPPIYDESEPQQFTNLVTSSVNPSVNQVVQLHKVHWGPKSAADKHKIILTAKFTPSYKDGVCFEQNAYGCMDEYGVAYPVWYDNSLKIESDNTDLPNAIRNLVEPYLINVAESVYMYPIQGSNEPSNVLKFRLVVIPDESKIDYICYDESYVMNISRVYAPVETKLTTYMAHSHQYPVSKVDSLSGKEPLPLHHLTGPISKQRDFCVWHNKMVNTFEKKSLIVPQTDCEILFTGDCSSSSNMAVSVVPDIHQNIPKIVKVKLEERVIEMEVNTGSTDKNITVKIDGRVRPMPLNRKLNVTNRQGQVIAVLECSNSARCQILCLKHDLYVNLQNQLATIEMNTNKVGSYCGVCARDSKLPQHPSEQVSKTVFQKNRVPGPQCTIREPYGSAQRPSDLCMQKLVHKIVIDNESGVEKRCVTEERLSTCSAGCKKVHRQSELKNVYCLSAFDSDKLGVTPLIEGSDMVTEIDRETLQKVMRSGDLKKMPVNVSDKCQ